MTTKREKSESFESMFRRFSKGNKQSGLPKEVKRRQSYDTKKRIKSKTRRKKSAIMREQKSAQIAYLKKIGRFEEDTSRQKRTR